MGHEYQLRPVSPDLTVFYIEFNFNTRMATQDLSDASQEGRHVITVVARKSAHGRSTLQVCQKGVGTLSSVSAFKHKRVPTLCLHALEANNRTNKNV